MRLWQGTDWYNCASFNNDSEGFVERCAILLATARGHDKWTWGAWEEVGHKGRGDLSRVGSHRMLPLDTDPMRSKICTVTCEAWRISPLKKESELKKAN